jgi:6-phosphofructo-2-kinase/fructose-2,6-biphosphatase 2
MVGLPARGKSFISKRISRYLNWLGFTTKVFNVGDYRRKIAGADVPHSFFDQNNKEANELRMKAAVQASADMIAWLNETSEVLEGADHCKCAIYDATNSTLARRTMIYNECLKNGIQVMFVESICTDQELIKRNILEVKIGSPDYVNMESEKATDDFLRRIKHYEDTYEPVNSTMTESDRSFVKLINIGSQVIINMIHGYLQSRVVYYLMNLHITSRSIIMCRHGESQFNVLGKIGGDSDLSERGSQFSKMLPSLIEENVDEATRSKLTVWTSTLRRTIQTAENLPYPKLQWKALDELDAGVCDGLTYEEIEERYPEDFAERDNDKFRYRYKGGESYKDLVIRLEPIIMELERQENIMIIGHQAVLRGICKLIRLLFSNFRCVLSKLVTR